MQAVQTQPAAEDHEASAGARLALRQTGQGLCAVIWIVQAKMGMKRSWSDWSMALPAILSAEVLATQQIRLCWSTSWLHVP